MVFYVFSKSVMIGHTWNHFILRYLLIIFSKSLGRVGNGNPSVGVDCVFVLIVGTLLLHVKHAAFFVFSACCTTGIYDLFDLLPTYFTNFQSSH